MRRLLALLLLSVAAAAGGGPETTLVVVNAGSPVSRKVAHEYVRLRDIPAGHLLYLDTVPHFGVIDLDTFLASIWTPIRDHLKATGLEGRIETIAYSADFPYAVDFRKRLPQGGGGQGVGTRAALTGVTYLVRQVEAEAEFWDLGANPWFGARIGGSGRPATPEERSHAMRATSALQAKRYAEAAEAYRAVLATYEQAPQLWYNLACCLALLDRADEAFEALGKAAATGFNNAGHAAQDSDLASLRKDARWAAALERIRKAPPPGMSVDVFESQGYASRDHDGACLAVMLAYTGPQGNSLEEILGYLRAAAGSDGKKPDGTVYFCRNGDVRSTTREPFFADVLALLRERGRKAEVVEGTLPEGKADVVGAVVGRAGFDWGKSKSTLLPGAICDHLTSFGAFFDTPGQTKLTEFLRSGAAGATGTVQEPLALHQKFPNPAIHVFYADGCSLAEAFFRSMSGPYQTLVVGDPLARPFATFETVTVEAPPAPWKGTVEIGAKSTGAIGRFELWVDGRFAAEQGVLPGSERATLSLDTTKLDDGHHEVRVVAVAAHPVATRSYTKTTATVDNHGRTAKNRSGSAGKAAYGVVFGSWTIVAPGAKEFELWQGSRIVARGGKGDLGDVGTGELGPGPFALVPRAVFPDGTAARGEPNLVDCDETAGIVRVQTPPPGPLKPGAICRVVDDRGERTEIVAGLDGLRFPGAQEVHLSGWIEISNAGFYQLAVRGSGTARVTFVGAPELALDQERYVAHRVDKGWWPLAISWKPRGNAPLEVRLGGAQVTAPVAIRHATFPALKDAPAAADGFAEVADGRRDGIGVAVSPDGTVLSWKKTVRDVAAVTLWPGSEAGAFPEEWDVEFNTGSGKFKPVKDLRTVVGPKVKRGQDGPEVPLFVEISWKPERMRKLRLAPKAEAVLAEAEVLGKGK